MESKHPLVAESWMPLLESWDFTIGEKVVLTSTSDCGRHGTIREVFIHTLEVNLEGVNAEISNLVSVRFEDVRKDVPPGSYVDCRKGKHRGINGLVCGTSGALLWVVPDTSHSKVSNPISPFISSTHSALQIYGPIHANSVKLVDSSSSQQDFPWKDVEVILEEDEHHGYIEGVIKMVRPDGYGSLRLIVYQEHQDSTVEVDYTDVIEKK